MSDNSLGFLLFCREMAASGKGTDRELLEEDWDDLSAVKKREYNERAAKKAANKPAGALKKTFGTLSARGSADGQSPKPSASASSPKGKDTAAQSKPKHPPAASASASSKLAGPKLSEGEGAASSSSVAGPPKLKHKQAVVAAPPSSPDKAVAPKKPRNAVDLYVLEAFAELKKRGVAQLDPPDLGAVAEERLRKVLNLVAADPKFAEGKSRAELLGAASERIASAGGLLRWEKANAQLDAKERWKTMPPEERRPFEEQSAAERERWERWQEEQEAQRREQERQQEAQQAAADDSSSDEGPVLSKRKGDAKPENNLLLKKRKRDDSDGKASKSSKGTKAPKDKAEKAAPGKKAGKDKGDEEKAAKEAVVVEEVECPELGPGWKCLMKPRAGATQKHVDKYYIAPDGKSYNSRIKVCVAHAALRHSPAPPDGRSCTLEWPCVAAGRMVFCGRGRVYTGAYIRPSVLAPAHVHSLTWTPDLCAGCQGSRV